MVQSIRPIKWRPDEGQFLVRIDSLINEVIDAVTERLRNEFKGEVKAIQHLVWARSSVEYSTLVISPRDVNRVDSLRSRMTEAMQRYVKQALNERSQARAS